MKLAELTKKPSDLHVGVAIVRQIVDDGVDIRGAQRMALNLGAHGIKVDRRGGRRDGYQITDWLGEAAECWFSKPKVIGTDQRDMMTKFSVVVSARALKRLVGAARRAAAPLLVSIVTALGALSLGRADTVGVPRTGAMGITESLADIHARDRRAAAQDQRPVRIRPVLSPDRRGLPQDPASQTAPQTPDRGALIHDRGPLSPQVVSTQFTGATLADTSAFPPDTIGRRRAEPIHRRRQRPLPLLQQDSGRRRWRA